MLQPLLRELRRTATPVAPNTAARIASLSQIASSIGMDKATLRELFGAAERHPDPELRCSLVVMRSLQPYSTSDCLWVVRLEVSPSERFGARYGQPLEPLLIPDDITLEREWWPTLGRT